MCMFLKGIFWVVFFVLFLGFFKHGLYSEFELPKYSLQYRNFINTNCEQGLKGERSQIYHFHSKRRGSV